MSSYLLNIAQSTRNGWTVADLITKIIIIIKGLHRGTTKELRITFHLPLNTHDRSTTERTKQNDPQCLPANTKLKSSELGNFFGAVLHQWSALSLAWTQVCWRVVLQYDLRTWRKLRREESDRVILGRCVLWDIFLHAINSTTAGPQ